MTEKHTPLPWMADPDERPGYEWNIHIVQQADANMRVCFMSRAEDSEISEANAELIVRSVNALPELVKALEPFVAIANAVFNQYETAPGQFREAYSDEPDDRPVWGFNRTNLTYGHLRAARAALAKVKP